MKMEQNKCIHIKNYKQACSYINNNVKPIDVYYHNGRLTFIFEEDATKEVWKRWLNHEEML